MWNKYKRYGKMTAFFAVLFICVMLSACSVKKRRSNTGVTASPEPQEVTYTVTGVVTNNDIELNQVSVRELNSDIDTILNYDDTAVITDKYGEEISGVDLEAGQIMDITYTTADDTLVSMEVPKDVWEYQEVRRFSFDGDNNALNVAGRKYQYSDDTYFAADGKAIQMMEITDQDIITVRGIGIKVYSVVKTEGHGYLRLLNYSDFVGGMINIGNDIILPITKDMLITVKEGIHRVTLSNKNVTATKTVTIKNDEETSADFSEYKVAAKNIGSVSFAIEPEGADLYINGTSIDYSKPVVLNYGVYNVRVEMTGYTTYTGRLDVEEPSRKIKINLIDKKAEAGNATASPKASATPSATASSSSSDSDKDNDSNTTTRKIDSSHTISVTEPEGAEVYLDNVYKGLAPCKFTKIIGSQTITLSKEGYVTKNYSVDVLDDDKNVKFSFADLVKED